MLQLYKKAKMLGLHQTTAVKNGMKGLYYWTWKKKEKLDMLLNMLINSMVLSMLQMEKSMTQLMDMKSNNLCKIHQSFKHNLLMFSMKTLTSIKTYTRLKSITNWTNGMVWSIVKMEKDTIQKQWKKYKILMMNQLFNMTQAVLSFNIFDQ